MLWAELLSEMCPVLSNGVRGLSRVSLEFLESPAQTSGGSVHLELVSFPGAGGKPQGSQWARGNQEKPSEGRGMTPSGATMLSNRVLCGLSYSLHFMWLS